MFGSCSATLTSIKAIENHAGALKEFKIAAQCNPRAKFRPSMSMQGYNNQLSNAENREKRTTTTFWRKTLNEAQLFSESICFKIQLKEKVKTWSVLRFFHHNPHCRFIIFCFCCEWYTTNSARCKLFLHLHGWKILWETRILLCSSSQWVDDLIYFEII